MSLASKIAATALALGSPLNVSMGGTPPLDPLPAVRNEGRGEPISAEALGELQAVVANMTGNRSTAELAKKFVTTIFELAEKRYPDLSSERVASLLMESADRAEIPNNLNFAREVAKSIAGRDESLKNLPRVAAASQSRAIGNFSLSVDPGENRIFLSYGFGHDTSVLGLQAQAFETRVDIFFAIDPNRRAIHSESLDGNLPLVDGGRTNVGFRVLPESTIGGSYIARVVSTLRVHSENRQQAHAPDQELVRYFRADVSQASLIGDPPVIEWTEVDDQGGQLSPWVKALSTGLEQNAQRNPNILP